MELKQFRYYHHRGGAWGKSDVCWYSIFATDLQMAKDVITKQHCKGRRWRKWQKHNGCWITTKPGKPSGELIGIP